MELTAASTAASAAITLLPGDTATPIAEKLADLSSSFLVVTCAILLEKYLITITGFLAFKILIPLSCILWILFFLRKRDICKDLAIKSVILGIMVVVTIPVSVKAADLIQDTYNVSIENTIASAKQATEAIEENAENEEEEGISSFLSKIKDSVAGTAVNLENVLNSFMEALAVMIVTSCLIPIAVIFFFIALIKSIFNVSSKSPASIWQRNKR
ncbi:MAG: hypothetical protein Q4E89_03875 [Eubacteriales bacterium]|nr:hypothetical protein [Eubacteriales bacterium]